MKHNLSARWTHEDSTPRSPAIARGDITAWAKTCASPIRPRCADPVSHISTPVTSLAKVSAFVNREPRPEPLPEIVAPAETRAPKQDVAKVVASRLAAADYMNRLFGLLK